MSPFRRCRTRRPRKTSSSSKHVGTPRINRPLGPVWPTLTPIATTGFTAHLPSLGPYHPFTGTRESHEARALASRMFLRYVGDMNRLRATFGNTAPLRASLFKTKSQRADNQRRGQPPLQSDRNDRDRRMQIQVLHCETRYASPFTQFTTNYATEVLVRALVIITASRVPI